MVGLCIALPETEDIRAHWDHVRAHFNNDAFYLIGEAIPDDIPLVLLQPDNGKFVRGTVSLEKFNHPENAIYMFGPDKHFFYSELMPEPDHIVYSPTDTDRDMFSFVAFAVTMWDRRMKRDSG